jgi:nucleotide-binding universal stress UspA family protein
MNIASIVAAIDFSDHARHAADRAAILAAEQQAKLDLVHVISGSSLTRLHDWSGAPADAEAKLLDDAQRSLNDMAEAIAGKTGIAARVLVKVGHVLDQILSASEGADLLVLGAHGSNALRNLILGTTADRLLRKRRRSVLVTKRRPEGGYRRALVPIDFSSCSADALNMARKIAPNAGITLFHVFQVPFEGSMRLAGTTDEVINQYCDRERQQALNSLRRLIQEATDGSSRMTAAVERGDAARMILAEAETLSADVIVIGKHGLSMVEDFLLGSVTSHVLAGSTCDVLVVHEQR